MEFSFEFHPASGAVKGLDSLGHRFPGNPHHPGSRGSSQGVQRVMPAQHTHIQVAVELSVTNNVEMLPVRTHVGRMDPVALSHSEENAVNSFHGLYRMGIVAVGDHAIGGQGGKLMEGFLDVRQILEIIQVIRLHIQNHRQGGEEIEEGIAVLAAFQNDGISVAHPMARVEQRQITADHDGGIHVRRHQNMGHHRGGRGFSVGAGNADGIFIGLHDLAPGLGPLKHGDPGGSGSGDFRVVVVGGCRTDDAVRAHDIFRVMANGHGNPLGLQLSGRGRRAHIRARDFHAHSLEDQAQGPHGNAANSNQMHMAAGGQKFGNILILTHKCQIPRSSSFCRQP